MRYSAILIAISLILLIISFSNIFSDLFKVTGHAISSTLQSQRLLRGIDYDLYTFEGGNNITVLIRFYNNITNLCINETRVNNISKEFSYEELAEKVYKIVIKDTNRYNDLFIRFCDGKFINETKYE